jgi:hypothetical protein
MTYLMQGRNLRRPLLGCGIRFPFSFGAESGSTTLGVATSEDTRLIEESIWIILGTRCAMGDVAGEDESLPDFGSMLWTVLYSKIGWETRARISAFVVDALRRWERRIVVGDVSFLSEALDRMNDRREGADARAQMSDLEQIERGIEKVNIPYEVIKTQAQGNCVYPFYLDSDLRVMGYGWDAYPMGR